MSEMAGLKALVRLPRGELRSPVVCLDEMILDGMVQTIQDFAAVVVAAGGQLITGHTVDGVEITVEPGNRLDLWWERLEAIVRDAHPGAFPEQTPWGALVAFLRADGWTVNDRTVKTPLWMRTHAELTVAQIRRQAERCEWLEKCSSATWSSATTRTGSSGGTSSRSPDGGSR